MKAGYRVALCLAGCLAAGSFRFACADAAPPTAIGPPAVGAPATLAVQLRFPTGFEAPADPIATTPPARAVVLDTVPIQAPAPPPRTPMWQSGLLRPDRIHHASLALASGLAIGLLTREPIAGAGGSLTLGVVKEIWDSGGRSGFDLVDLAADAIGAGVSALLTSGLLLR